MKIIMLKKLVTLLPDFPRKNILKAHYLKKFRNADQSDEDDLALLPELISEGETVFDIGANFGLFTRFLSEAVGERGKVYSFEPLSEIFEVLQNNVTSVELGNVSCSNVALSDRSGEAEMRVPKHDDGTPNYYEASLVINEESSNSAAESISTLTLDNFCEKQGIQSISFIKCDVEGHEIEVLTGAQNVLKRDRPIILLEINEPFDDGAHGTAVVDFVKGMDYEFYIYEDKKISPWHSNFDGVNYILFPSEKVPK